MGFELKERFTKIITANIHYMTDKELKEIEHRANQATKGPWKAYIEDRDHESGSSFIMTAGSDIELIGATEADYDFIAHVRQDIPKLLQALKELKQE